MAVGTNLREFVEAVITATGGGGGGDHATLTNRAWVASLHTGTASRIAAFDGAGAAAYLQVGTDVQAYDADLAAIAGLSPSNGDVVYRSGGAWTSTAIGTIAAAVSHTHAAADITSGTIATARLGSGTATGAVLVGGAWVAGSASGDVLRWSGSAWAASALSASDISTGSVSVAARLGWSSTTTTASTTDATNGTTTNTPSWSVTTGKTYMVEMIGTFDCAAGTSGFRVRLEESGGASSSACAGQVWYSHASGIAAEPITAAGTWTAAGTGSTSRAGIEMRATYVCTGTGTLKLGIRPETAASNVNLYAKTIYRLLEI